MAEKTGQRRMTGWREMKAIPLNAELNKVIHKRPDVLFANFSFSFERQMKVELFKSFHMFTGYKDLAVINNSMNWMPWKLQHTKQLGNQAFSVPCIIIK